MVALIQAPSSSPHIPPPTDPAGLRLRFTSVLHDPSFIVQGKFKSKPRNDRPPPSPTPASLLSPQCPGVYAVQSSPTRFPRSAAFPRRLTPPRPRTLQHPSLPRWAAGRDLQRDGDRRSSQDRAQEDWVSDFGHPEPRPTHACQRRLKLAGAAARSVAGESRRPRRPKQCEFEREGQAGAGVSAR